jgi:hypothetical protein
MKTAAGHITHNNTQQRQRQRQRHTTTCTEHAPNIDRQHAAAHVHALHGTLLPSSAAPPNDQKMNIQHAAGPCACAAEEQKSAERGATAVAQEAAAEQREGRAALPAAQHIARLERETDNMRQD